MNITHLPDSWANPTQQTDVLWRFISFDKFAAVLETNSLYFSRTDQYDDPTEGLVPYQWNIEFHKGLPEYFSFSQPSSKMQTMFASCWYRGADEPAQLWRLNPENSSGICIRTTQARLLKALGAATSSDPKITHLVVGAIKYINHHDYISPIPAVRGNAESHHWNIWSHFLKKKAFIHEQEFRILFDNMEYGSCPHPSQPEGINLKINLNQLIDKIIISPYVLPHLSEVVRKLLIAYGLTVEVEQSSLLECK